MKNPETNCACLFAFTGLEYVHAYIQASKQRGGCKRAMRGGEKGVSWNRVATGMGTPLKIGIRARIRVWGKD